MKDLIVKFENEFNSMLEECCKKLKDSDMSIMTKYGFPEGYFPEGAYNTENAIQARAEMNKASDEIRSQYPFYMDDVELIVGARAAFGFIKLKLEGLK